MRRAVALQCVAVSRDVGTWRGLSGGHMRACQQPRWPNTQHCFLQFSGGNQQAGQGGNVTSDSLPGAMAAARVNGGFPNQ